MWNRWQHEGPEGYRASQADQTAWDRALRAKPCKRALHRALAARVAEKIQRQWSPEQVAGWLKRHPTEDARTPQMKKPWRSRV